MSMGKVPRSFLPRVRSSGTRWAVMWMGRQVYDTGNRSWAKTFVKHMIAFLRRQQSMSTINKTAWISSFNDYLASASVLGSGFDPPIVIV